MNGRVIKTTHYIGNFVYENAGLSYILSGEGFIVPQNGKMVYQYYMKDHLGNNRAVFDQDNLVVQNNVYYPFGMLVQPMRTSRMSTTPNLYLYNGKELQDDFDLDWYDYGARFYDAQIGRWHSVDPLAEDYPSWTPYHYVHNNPINLIDQTGMSADWIEGADGEIKWDENATSQATTKEGETYLGKNLLVGTHNRDENGNEEINSATFSLYLESNTEGATATIEGNTVPGDTEKQGTLAEGVYDADYADFKGKPALLIGKGGDLPATDGNPNNPDNYNADGTLKPTSEHVMDEIFFHKGNVGKERLWYQKSNGQKGYISEGCQTGPNGQNSLPRYLNFMKNVDKSFSGKYYLRGRK